MKKADKDRIAQLAEALSAIPDLPKEPAKSLDQKISEVGADIKKLSDLRAKAVAPGATDFDRTRFEFKKNLLMRELKKIEQTDSV